MEADRKWWNVAPARQPRLKAMVFVVDGVVTRIRGVNPVETWNKDDDRGFADLTLTKPLKDNAEVDKLVPSLPMPRRPLAARSREDPRVPQEARARTPWTPSGPLGERDVVGTEINHIPPESVTGFG
ncbi:hypothetical protein EV644_13935 [Kribbella orskensis]|uniref:Mutator family transposase n=1 Tax=Kribbella orskensis TaxID=2512216 RepID=A0ABY2B7D9_9ACTN|nr:MULTISPECIES: hypothetical protein [Kribbella]TCN29247.1 hypothetical protein EV642_14214 [Kribbella sp. VKM Ac-2500]TCO09568.1 hypothetical protein EV644_13935 [Kribbella orskensis]